MANKKITELTATTTVADTDLAPVVTDPGGTPTTKKITVANLKATLFASPAFTGTATAAALTASGTVTANLFSGSGASLTSIPQSAVTNLVSDLAGKSSTSHTHTLSALSGSVTNAQLPDPITGRSSVSAEQFKGVTNAGNIIDLQNSASEFLRIVSGATWSIGNNSTATTPSTVGPTGMTTHAAADKFIVVNDNGTTYYLRLEKWS